MMGKPVISVDFSLCPLRAAPAGFVSCGLPYLHSCRQESNVTWGFIEKGESSEAREQQHPFCRFWRRLLPRSCLLHAAHGCAHLYALCLGTSPLLHCSSSAWLDGIPFTEHLGLEEGP